MCCARNSGWINITLGFALYSAFNHFRNALLRTVGIPETGNHSALCSLNAKKYQINGMLEITKGKGAFVMQHRTLFQGAPS